MNVAPLMVERRKLTIWGAAALAALWLAMMLTGTGPADHMLLHALYAADQPDLRPWVIFVTYVGQWPMLIVLTLIGVLWLLYRREPRRALLLLSITLIGRALIDLQKFGIGRLRPEDQVHLVPVKSLSFPSGHSGNTMIVLLSLALLVPPPRYRTVAIIVALVASIAIGITRPMLGVHWPSDVVGGWAFGAAWVLWSLAAAERIGRRHSESRNHEERLQ
jgi:membrane-associated phospholipid phosphatase